VAGAAIAGVGAIALALWYGEPILNAIYTPEYARRADVFCWLTVATALGAVGSFLGYGMTAARRFVVQAPLFAIIVVVTSLACYFLIPRYGLRGAALSTTIAMFVQVAGSALVVRSMIRGETEQ
jgi:O-antigen/teichoic acid export membrane protein